MKQEQWTPQAPTRRPAGREQGATRADVELVTPKLTRLAAPKIVTPKPPPTDAKALDRVRLLAGLLVAKGRIEVTRAADAYFAAGHALDLSDQAPHLQLLEHADEGRVRDALVVLTDILCREPARHRPVLEQRITRIEATAEEVVTRDAAKALRRSLH